jgi:hypothetical protein
MAAYSQEKLGFDGVLPHPKKMLTNEHRGLFPDTASPLDSLPNHAASDSLERSATLRHDSRRLAADDENPVTGIANPFDRANDEIAFSSR